MSMIAKYDAALAFGEAALASATACPDVLEIGKSQPDRMAVNVIVTETATGGTSVVFKIAGSNDNSSYNDVAVSPSIALAKLTKDANFAIPVPQGWNYKYMKVSIAKTGTFTAGKVTAAVDVYQGV